MLPSLIQQNGNLCTILCYIVIKFIFVSLIFTNKTLGIRLFLVTFMNYSIVDNLWGRRDTIRLIGYVPYIMLSYETKKIGWTQFGLHPHNDWDGNWHSVWVVTYFGYSNMRNTETVYSATECNLGGKIVKKVNKEIKNCLHFTLCAINISIQRACTLKKSCCCHGLFERRPSKLTWQHCTATK